MQTFVHPLKSQGTEKLHPSTTPTQKTPENNHPTSIKFCPSLLLRENRKSSSWTSPKLRSAAHSRQNFAATVLVLFPEQSLLALFSIHLLLLEDFFPSKQERKH